MSGDNWFSMDKLVNKARDAKEAQKWADHKKWVEDLIAEDAILTQEQVEEIDRDELDAEMFDERDFTAWEDDEL